MGKIIERETFYLGIPLTKRLACKLFILTRPTSAGRSELGGVDAEADDNRDATDATGDATGDAADADADANAVDPSEPRRFIFARQTLVPSFFLVIFSCSRRYS